MLVLLLVVVLLLLLVVVVKESDERREWRLKIARGEEQEEEDVFKLANITFLKNIHQRSHSPHLASNFARTSAYSNTRTNQTTLLSLSLSLKKKTCASLPPPPLLFLRWLRRLIHRQRALEDAEDITRRRRYPKQRDG